MMMKKVESTHSDRSSTRQLFMQSILRGCLQRCWGRFRRTRSRKVSAKISCASTACLASREKLISRSSSLKSMEYSLLSSALHSLSYSWPWSYLVSYLNLTVLVMQVSKRLCKIQNGSIGLALRWLWLYASPSFASTRWHADTPSTIYPYWSSR